MKHRAVILSNIGCRIAGVAAGIIIGLGFVAAAVKFTAKKPDLLDLLDVGRVQFGALHQVEWLLVPLSCGLVALGGRRNQIVAGAAFGLLVIKTLFIQPALHQHMVSRLEGKPISGSSPHLEYLIISLLMVICLLFLSLSGTRHNDANLG